jgi:hypothetical protein
MVKQGVLYVVGQGTATQDLNFNNVSRIQGRFLFTVKRTRSCRDGRRGHAPSELTQLGSNVRVRLLAQQQTGACSIGPPMQRTANAASPEFEIRRKDYTTLTVT